MAFSTNFNNNYSRPGGTQPNPPMGGMSAFSQPNNNNNNGFQGYGQQNNNNTGFGMNNNNNNAFGGFGQQNNNNNGSGFGFGQQNNNNNNNNAFGGFGQQNNNNNNAGFGFGQQNNNNNNNASGFGGFGQQNNNNNAFGGFGQQNNNGSGFGGFGQQNNNNASGFGGFGQQNNNNNGGLFGQQNNNGSGFGGFGQQNNNNNNGMFSQQQQKPNDENSYSKFEEKYKSWKEKNDDLGKGKLTVEEEKRKIKETEQMYKELQPQIEAAVNRCIESYPTVPEENDKKENEESNSLFSSAATKSNEKEKDEKENKEKDEEKDASIEDMIANYRKTFITENPKRSNPSVKPTNQVTKENEIRMPKFTETETMYCVPSMKKLQQIYQEDPKKLTNLPRFEIGKQLVAKIVWENVDISNLDLDEIVGINNHDIVVYPKGSTVDPPETKLNKRAQITFDFVYNIMSDNELEQLFCDKYPFAEEFVKREGGGVREIELTVSRFRDAEK